MSAVRLSLFLALVLTSAVRGQVEQQVAVSFPFGPIYPANTWLPLDVACLNRSDRVADGTIHVVVSRPPARTFVCPVRVAPNSRTRVRLLVSLPDVDAASAKNVAALQLGMVEWRGKDSEVLARSELYARPDTLPKVGASRSDQGGQLTGRGILVITESDPDTLTSELGIANTVATIEQALGRPMFTATVTPDAAPDDPQAYSGVHVVVLEQLDPERIPAAQREALLRFVQGGGTLLVAVTGERGKPTGSWLDPYLPVDFIGSRLVASLPRDDGPPVKLKSLLPISEAVAREDAKTILGDSNFCLAAARPLGLGQVAYLGFHPGGIVDPEQWSSIARPLLGLTSLELRLARLEDPTENRPIGVLSTMVGREAPPWRQAALVCGGLLIVVIGAHFAFRGASRPWAFASVSLLSLAMSGLLVGVSAAKRGSANLAAAHLAVTELGADGSGTRADWLTLFGADDPTLTISADDPFTALRNEGGDSVTLSQPPFAAPRVGARASGGTVWIGQTDRPAPAMLDASIQFTQRGAEIKVRRIDAPLDSPILLLNGRAFPLPTIESVGSLPVGNANPPGQLTVFSTMSSEEAKLRSRLAQFVSSVPTTIVPLSGELRLTPVLLAFERSPRSLVTPSTSPGRWLSQSLLRMDLRVLPGEIGQTVRVPGAMVRLVTDAAPGLPVSEGRVIRASGGGAWLVGFAPPAALGELQPTRAQLQLDAVTPLHRMTVRRGQVRDGLLQENPDGEIVAEMSQTIGDRRAEFVPDENDVDRNGWVWLRLDVSEPTQISETSRRDWEITTFDLTLEGRVVGPSRTPVKTWRPQARPAR
jgi:hypothetical protein